jgi:predicted phosphodiesterase
MDYPQIAIEHGHRYDFFCAMTPGSNEDGAPGSIFGPGYFFARIAANSFVDPTTPEESTKVPEVKLNDKTDAEQQSKYIYYNIWKNVLEKMIYVKDDFNEPIIKTNIGNFTKTYSINDVIPRNNPRNGEIEMNLYNGLFTQANWEERAQYNNVPVMTEINKAMVGSLETEFIDNMSYLQYFNNPSSNTRIVVFGHTHLPMVKSFINHKGDHCIYVNSGTWEDSKSRDKEAVIDQDTINMHFVLITPTKAGQNHLQVGLYQYRNGNHFKAEAMELYL